ncbi:MAG TPA: PhoPQ-activated protein PqaA family protein [Candidatus Hydrogenedentes bacterium]|nr:PhoPQ-activated protein PqaA family protein [Candidatus Hydrogenedentota bacterium]
MPKAHLVKYAVVLTALTLLLAGCPERTVVSPVPQFTFSPSQGTAPLQVLFADASIPGDSTIESWSWDFGDGGVGNSPTPQHTYRVPGTYDVTLCITTGEGNFSIVKEGAIVVQDSNTFGEPDDTGLFRSGGVEIQLSESLDNDIAFSVQKGAAPIALGAYGIAEAISPVFTILHNQASPDLFVYDDNGVPEAATISLELSNPLPNSGIPLNNAQLFVRLDDKRVLPVPGTVANQKFTASILRLPQRADYVVVRSAELKVTRVTVKGDMKDTVAPNWTNDFIVYAGNEAEQALTALYRGSMDSEDSFRRRSFSALDVEQSMRKFTGYMSEAQVTLAGFGMPVPTLVGRDGAFTLTLFNMHPKYDYDFERATDVPYYDTFFGHLVLDPVQLAAITIRNVRRVTANKNDLDFMERFYPQSAFNEALIQSVYPGYVIPSFTTTGNTALGLPIPADQTALGGVKPISFLQGLLDGTALYFGRRSLDYPGRGFGANEYGKLSLPALFPYSRHVPGYSYAGHELLAWLDGTDYVDDPLAMITRCLAGMNAALREAGSLYTRPINYAEARVAVYKALDRAIRSDAGSAFTSLADLYWVFLKDYAYLNGWNAVLRPSDTNRPPFAFNRDRFEEEFIVEEAFKEAASEKILSPANTDALADIEPMAARAVILDLNPMTTSIDIFLDTSVLDYGYIPKVAVYREGQAGVEFSDMPGETRNYSLMDTDEDGRTDTIRIIGLGGVDMNASNRVFLFVANLQYEDAASLTLDIKTYSELPVGDEGVLARFVSTHDPQYAYEVEQAFNYNTPGGGAKIYLIRMDSGVWRGAQEVEETLWQHTLLVLEPFNVNKNTGMLYITGDTDIMELLAVNEENSLLGMLGALAISSRSVVSLLTNVPNQPLNFLDETLPLSDDKLLAYSFDKYISGYDEGNRDAAWPVLLPMTRAAVRAMDTVQDFMADKPRRVQDIEDFIVSGVAKQGWTAWLAGAVDSRVSAIIPVAADILNLDAQMKHHANVYAGYPPNSSEKFVYEGYSSAWRDYVNYDIFNRLDMPAGESLLKIIDPYQYKTLLTIPKLLVNSTGDQYLPPDTSRFFVDDLSGVNYLHFASNVDFSVLEVADLGDDTMEAIGAFYIAQTNNSRLPTFTAAYDEETTTITVTASETPLSVHFWYANTAQSRDFRMQTLGDKWVGRSVPASLDGSYSATIGEPESGWNAGYMQLRMKGPFSGIDHIFTTRVWITPDTYPQAP